MKLIDERGKLFGKINIIDFLVVLCIVAFVPTAWYGQKILSQKDEVDLGPDYTVFRRCPNCKWEHMITLDKGTPVPTSHKVICPQCGIDVELIKQKSKPEIKEDYVQEYYKRLLQKGKP